MLSPYYHTTHPYQRPTGTQRQNPYSQGQLDMAANAGPGVQRHPRGYLRAHRSAPDVHNSMPNPNYIQNMFMSQGPDPFVAQSVTQPRIRQNHVLQAHRSAPSFDVNHYPSPLSIETTPSPEPSSQVVELPSSPFSDHEPVQSYSDDESSNRTQFVDELFACPGNTMSRQQLYALTNELWADESSDAAIDQQHPFAQMQEVPYDRQLPIEQPAATATTDFQTMQSMMDTRNQNILLHKGVEHIISMSTQDGEPGSTPKPDMYVGTARLAGPVPVSSEELLTGEQPSQWFEVTSPPRHLAYPGTWDVSTARHYSDQFPNGYDSEPSIQWADPIYADSSSVSPKEGFLFLGENAIQRVDDVDRAPETKQRRSSRQAKPCQEENSSGSSKRRFDPYNQHSGRPFKTIKDGM